MPPRPSVVVITEAPDGVVSFVEHLERRQIAVRVVWEPRYAVHAAVGARATVVLDAELSPPQAARVRAAAAGVSGGVPMPVLTLHTRTPPPGTKRSKSRPERVAHRWQWPRLTLMHAWSLVAALLIPALVVSACGLGAVSQTPAPPALTTVATPTPKPSAVVKRGSITGRVRAGGRLVPATEVPLAFAAGGQIRSVKVGVGDKVEAGAVLADLDASVSQHQVDDAAFELEVRKLRLEQARARAPSTIEVTLARAALDRAEADVRRARAKLERIRAGTSPSRIRAAEAEAVSLEAQFHAAQAKLDRLNRPPASQELGESQVKVEAARVALDQAKAAFEARTGQQKLAVTEESLAVARAQLDFEQAQQVFTDLQAGKPSDPARVVELEGQLQGARTALARARLQLQEAERGGKPDQSPEARQIAVLDARTALNAAQSEVNRLTAALQVAQAPASSQQLERARIAMEQAQVALRDAQARYKAAANRKDPTLTKEGLALARAKLEYDIALRELRGKIEGPDDETRLRVQAEVAAAEAAFREAEAQLSQLRQGPTPEQLSEAEEAVQAAETALSVAQAEYNLKVEQLANQRLELALGAKILEREVQRDERKLAELRRVAGATRLIAPVAGTVITIEKKPRDTVEAGETVMVLSDLALMMATASFSEADASALYPGKPATISFPGIANITIPGTVTEVSRPRLTDTGSVVRAVVRLLEQRDGIRAGQPVDIAIGGVTRDNALIAPLKAIRANGPTWLATMLGERNREREVEVRVGLINDHEVEIIGGLREGDRLLLPVG